ncbi:MAG: cytochrome c [Acidimicrobiia bacterium]
MSSFRDILILINAIAFFGIAAFIAFRVFSLRRNPEPHKPQNLERFYDDEVLEGPHLERVLGVALVALVISVVGLVAYFIWEPFRGADAVEGFKDRAVERGAILFAGTDSPEYDSTKSLLCASCHGSDGRGGVAPFVVKSEDPRCSPTQKVNEDLEANQPYCLPEQVGWAAPSLQLAGLRYSRAQLTNIITYGRPGTPMPAWGIASGKGVLNAQGVADLVAYVESIVTTSEKANAQADKEFEAMRTTLNTPEVQAKAARWVEDRRALLAQAEGELAALPADATPKERSVADATVVYMRDVLAVAEDWYDTTQFASTGKVLFMNNCARCHTRGWSYFDPTDPEGNPPPGEMGSGAYGPNLTDGDVNGQFPAPNGDAQLFAWIAEGVPANAGYGIRGISSGRMPHFGAVLSKEQIESIMEYERGL